MKQSILSIFKTGLFFCLAAGMLTFASPIQAASQNECWCCVDGKVVQISAEQCKEKGGQCYPTKYEAEKNCRGELCWCCIDGKVVQILAEECKEKGGRCYRTMDEAKKYCEQPRVCWCCIKGNLYQIPEEECKKKQGRCYWGTKDEAAKRCVPPVVRKPCCVEGRYKGVSVDSPKCGGKTSNFTLTLKQPNCGRKVTGRILDPATGAATSTLVGTITSAGRNCCKFEGKSKGIAGTNDEGCEHRIKATFCLVSGKWVVRDGTFSIITGKCCAGGTFRLKQL